MSQLSQKLIDPSTEPKTYWKIINRFVNNKKTPIIPPLLVNNKIISNFSEKANLFKKFLLLSAPLWKIIALYFPFA